VQCAELLKQMCCLATHCLFAVQWMAWWGWMLRGWSGGRGETPCAWPSAASRLKRLQTCKVRGWLHRWLVGRTWEGLWVGALCRCQSWPYSEVLLSMA
jgi:hypothetical protein